MAQALSPTYKVFLRLVMYYVICGSAGVLCMQFDSSCDSCYHLFLFLHLLFIYIYDKLYATLL